MIQLLLPVCMMKEASGIRSRVTSTCVSTLTAKILIGYAMKIKMSQLLSFLPETDAPQKRLGKVRKKSEWILNSFGSRLVGRFCKIKLLEYDYSLPPSVKEFLSRQ